MTSMSSDTCCNGKGAPCRCSELAGAETVAAAAAAAAASFAAVACSLCAAPSPMIAVLMAASAAVVAVAVAAGPAVAVAAAAGAGAGAGAATVEGGVSTAATAWCTPSSAAVVVVVASSRVKWHGAARDTKKGRAEPPRPRPIIIYLWNTTSQQRTATHIDMRWGPGSLQLKHL